MSKKAKFGKKQSGKSAAAKLPAGFTAVSLGGGFGAWWDFAKQKTITGRVTAIDSYMQENDNGKKEKRRILRVDTGNGVTMNVGESYALRELFDVPKLKGKQVFIQFLGQKSFKNKKGKMRKVNQFAASYK